MSTIEAGLRGGGIAVLLMLALFGWRDARHVAAGRYHALFMLCGASYLVESAPGLALIQPAWIIPLRVLSVATPAVFQLWASAAFDDSFRPSWFAWLPTAAMAALAAWAIAMDRWLPWRIVNGAALVLVAFGIWQVLGGRAGDLVEGRRRFRLVLAITAGLSIAGFTVLGTISSAQARTLGSFACAGIVFALAATSATLRLGLRAQPEFAGEPVAVTDLPLDPLAGAAVTIDPEERAWLDRLRQVMETERAYREGGFGIAALAARLSLPEYRLRRLINQRLGHRNFSSFINGYRLAETIAALSDPGQLQVPVLTIALDAGFQSLGPFNRAFKAQTGMTPTDFRREYMQRNASRAAE
ncbi:MAG TPA: helix-turn-helix domain-containing protein [Stellaceae bacterium]|nr:helix-turn-helix domain-containing protein [Stellaceae bacterium]